METQSNDPWELNDLEIQDGDRMIGGMDKKATVNLSILYNTDLMEKNEQDVPCTSPARKIEGTVPEVYGIRSSEDEYNADIVGYNNQGSFQEPMQENFQDQMQERFQGLQIAYEPQQQQDFHNLTVYNQSCHLQEQYANSQQCNNNYSYYAGCHQPVYHGEGHYYEDPQQVQTYFDVSTVAAPVDPNNYPQQPVYQQYEEPIRVLVQPTPQLDVSSLEIKKSQPPARYRKRSEKLIETTASRRHYTPRIPRGQEQGYYEELMVPDIAEEQSGCSRRGRGKVGTKQSSVQRHRQSIKDFLASAPNNIENLEKMNLAVTQANEELDRMFYALQEMIDYGMVPELY